MLVLGFSSPSWAEGCGDVTITQMDWASANVVTAVSKFLMEQGYGCKVTTVPSSTPDGADIGCRNRNARYPDRACGSTPPRPMPSWSSEGKIVELTDVLSDGGIEGWWVPQYVVDAHPEAATLEGILANPDWVGGQFRRLPRRLGLPDR